MNWQPTLLPYTSDLETKPVLKALNRAHRALAELKGVARSILRQDIQIIHWVYRRPGTVQKLKISSTKL